MIKYFGIKIILQLYILIFLYINNWNNYPERNLDGENDGGKSAETQYQSNKIKMGKLIIKILYGGNSFR